MKGAGRGREREREREKPSGRGGGGRRGEERMGRNAGEEEGGLRKGRIFMRPMWALFSLRKPFQNKQGNQQFGKKVAEVFFNLFQPQAIERATK